jgi:four helix bundle protein
MYTFSFEKLEVWKEARKFAVAIYKLTQTFPDAEKWGMISQIRRSARSVAANIAEGSTRFSAKDQSHFYSIAFGSAIEILNDLLIAHDLEWLSSEDLLKYRVTLEQITFMLNALRKSTNPSIP